MNVWRPLSQAHRYLGIALCLLFAMWFASGIVMMYVSYPSLDAEERLTGLPDLQLDDGVRSPAELVRSLPDVVEPQSVRLTAALGTEVYHTRGAGLWRTYDARTGEPLIVTLEHARASAARHLPAGHPEEMERIDRDQWTVANRYDAHRPLYRFTMTDPAHSLVYVSSRTGEVVLDVTRPERAWNLVGSILHWIYPWQLRQHVELWRQIVIWVSFAGVLVVVSGIVTGLRRMPPFRRNAHSISPFRGWFRWHHLLGVVSSFYLLTFILSGMLSLNPGPVFHSAGPTPGQTEFWQGGPVLPADLARPADVMPAASELKELAWKRHAGEPQVRARKPGEEVTLHAVQGEAVSHSESALLARAGGLLPWAEISGVERLSEYDSYYYSRTGSAPLPVIRVQFANPAATAVYINADTGALEAWIERGDRAERWLFNGLHSLDFPLLWENRPLWDIVLITLCLTGFGFSVTGVVLGWRRLAASQRAPGRAFGKAAAARRSTNMGVAQVPSRGGAGHGRADGVQGRSS